MTNAGDRLRDQIAQLLRMKFQNVEVEKRLETTTADVLFVDDTNPIFPRTIAIEAKDWKSKLSSEDIATIYNLYPPSAKMRSMKGNMRLARRSRRNSRGLRYRSKDRKRGQESKKI